MLFLSHVKFPFSSLPACGVPEGLSVSLWDSKEKVRLFEYEASCEWTRTHYDEQTVRGNNNEKFVFKEN